MARECRKKTEYMQNNPTSGWSGTDDKTKGMQGKGKCKQDKGKGKGPSKGKGKGKSKGKGKHHGKKGKKGFHEMERHEDKQETRTSQDCAEWTDTSGDHADNWTDADWLSSNWSADLWADLHGNKRHHSWHRRNLVKNSRIQRTEAVFQC